MSDITMCDGGRCPVKEQCYRYTAKPTPKWQSYFYEIPYNFEKKECENLWLTKTNRRV